MISARSSVGTLYQAKSMIRYVSLAWNALFIVMALLAPVLMYQGLLEGEQIVAQYEGSFSDGERAFGVLLSTSIVWLALLVIWAIGAFILWPFKSAARRKATVALRPTDRLERQDPRL